ncbi:MAG: response regulator, partial [Bacteroidales bacterium]|nr:response regulator [Bacteroidales bacterium]
MKNKDEIEILIVEDNPNDAEMALRALKENKLTNNVLVARDGEEALNYIFARGNNSYPEQKIRPKIILLDLKLPRVSGLEVLKELKNHPDTQMIPVIVLTTSREEKDIIESYRLGVNSYIIKPVDFEKFIEAV